MSFMWVILVKQIHLLQAHWSQWIYLHSDIRFFAFFGLLKERLSFAIHHYKETLPTHPAVNKDNWAYSWTGHKTYPPSLTMEFSLSGFSCIRSTLSYLFSFAGENKKKKKERFFFLLLLAWGRTIFPRLFIQNWKLSDNCDLDSLMDQTLAFHL